jgi:hypothetical protein
MAKRPVLQEFDDFDFDAENERAVIEEITRNIGESISSDHRPIGAEL